MENQLAEQRQVVNALLDLLPVVIGGLIAVVGGAVASWWSHSYQRAAERRDHRRQALEEICELAFALDAWLLNLMTFHFYGFGGEPAHQWPADRLQVLARLYLRDLTDIVYTLVATATQYKVWVYKGGEMRHKLPPGSEVPQAHREKQNEMYRPVREAVEVLIERASQTARSLE
jgi:hypothetical protein